MSLLFTSEHELKEKFGHEGWQESLSTYSNEADIFLHYSCIESDETKAALRDFAESLDDRLKIVIFEECVEKGGGGDNGIIPSLMEYVFNAGVFTFTAVAAGFLQEMGKDTYKSSVKKFGEFRRRMATKGALCIKLVKENGNVLHYYYPKSLTAEQAIEGFRAMRDHFSNTTTQRFESRFFYVSKLAEWEQLT